MLAIAIPVVLLIAVGLVLWAQIARMTELARAVDHSDRVIASIYEVENEISDQEGGLRGFLLTHDRSFLAPYEHEHPGLLFATLKGLVADNPPQQVRVIDAARRYDAWRKNAELLTDPNTPPEQLQNPSSLATRRRLMDGVNDAMHDLLRIEQDLRHARLQHSEAANQNGVYLAALLFVALTLAIAFVTRTQLMSVSQTYAEALTNERATRASAEEQNWLRAEHMKLSKNVQGDLTLERLGNNALTVLVANTQAVIGAFYVAEGAAFRRSAGHALSAGAPETFEEGEGLLGRAAAEKQVLHVRDVPADALRVRSGIADRAPAELAIVPACVDGVTVAVLELGFFTAVTARTRELLERVGETIAVAVRSANHKLRLRELLEESRRQAEELQTQQEELRVVNEELQAQSDALRLAHAQLEERKEELETTNAHLVAQRDALENMQRQLADKATELERASRYKSEFLANMSHELRTPLNSSLILAKLLADNRPGNLNEEQIKFANTIYAAGNDLLALINDILDLSKIEAGHVEVHARQTALGRLVQSVVNTCEPLAKQKQLKFTVDLDEELPITTDEQRVQQILKNLLSNALKFTERGEVGLRAHAVADGVEFVVHDTGIGIPEHQHEVIFEAFRQADGTTNRKYGGTGLGLSISRDLTRLLGGELRVESEPGKGSRFILRLPREYRPPAGGAPAPPPRELTPRKRPTPLPPTQQPALVRPVQPRAAPAARPNGHRSLLVIEDDPNFSVVLENLARELEFDCVVARSADEGVRVALEQVPSAVVLDMKLPDHSGLSVLDRLKRDPNTRHIPVHVISATDLSLTALSMGAAGYLVKPVERDQLVQALSTLKERFSRMRHLLVVEDDPAQRAAVAQLLQTQDVEITGVDTVDEALRQLREKTFDCVVTDLSLPDASGFDLLEQLASNDSYAFPPVIVYTGRSLAPDEEQRLRRYSNSIIIKGARSPERLLDEVTLFLHQVESELPPDRQRMLQTARDREAAFSGRKILIAEDDVRNIFALGHVLEPRGAEVVIARNGREAVETLEKRSDIDLVLMDIMMPEMDGLEAMRSIRRRGGRYAKLPIIALTAKAMPDDQERCIEAGASDYIPKPLDVEMLLSLIRVWMPN